MTSVSVFAAHNLWTWLIDGESTLVRRKLDTNGATTSGVFRWVWWSPGTVTTVCWNQHKLKVTLTADMQNQWPLKWLINDKNNHDKPFHAFCIFIVSQLQTHVSVTQTLEKWRGKFMLSRFRKFSIITFFCSGKKRFWTYLVKCKKSVGWRVEHIIDSYNIDRVCDLHVLQNTSVRLGNFFQSLSAAFLLRTLATSC